MSDRGARSEAKSSRLVSLVFVLLIAAAVPLVGILQPLSVAAADCDGVDQYIEQRREIRDAYRADFIEQLPGIPHEWEISRDDWFDVLLSLSDDQLLILSELWADRADAMRELTPPAIVQTVHDEDVLDAQLRSNLLRDAASMGLLTAGLMYTDADEATPLPGQSSDDLLAAACPAWDAYLAESSATPTPA